MGQSKGERQMKIVVANHKMNLTASEILTYEKYIEELDKPNLKIVICPSMLYLSSFKIGSCKLGSQNVAVQEKTNLTGEVSARQLKSVGVAYSIVGHSERRTALLETNEMIRSKIIELHAHNIMPILCIGETLIEKNKELTIKALEKQISECLRDITKPIIVAYEPVWAIGTGVTPSKEEIEQTVSIIRILLETNRQPNAKVLYGGSVNYKTISMLEEIKKLDGYLIGGASINPKELVELLNMIK